MHKELTSSNIEDRSEASHESREVLELLSLSVNEVMKHGEW